MKRIIVPVMLGLILLLAACGGAATPVAEPAAVAPDAAVVESDEMADDEMAEDMASDEMASDEMANDDMADDMSGDDMADDSGEMAEGDEASHDDMAEAIMDEAMDGDDSSEAMMDEGSMMELAAWQTLPLVDARTGESFTLADYSGRTVFVEPMATWCSNCRQQLTNVQQARTNPATEDAVFVALSVETSISDEELARYADQFGFDWTFAVATPEMLQALAEEFGRSVANPPSTPHFVVSPDGSFTELFTGIQSADEIAALAGG